MSTTTILVADPLKLFAESLAFALNAQQGFEVFDEYPLNGPATVSAAVRLRPDFALIDYWMPDMDGPVITRSILSQAPHCNVLLLSWLSSPEHLEQSLAAGAVGFVPKDASIQDVVDAIRRVYAGEHEVYAKELAGVLWDRGEAASEEMKRFQTLTPRQIEVLALLHAGNTRAEIAKRLSISFKTASNHVSDILNKVGALTQNELIARARRCGFLRT